MTKIVKSLAMIAFVAAIGVYATSSFFSDTETSTGNTFTAGTIDISVDGENPWNTSWSNYLDKPCQTNYMKFVIENEGENPANVWKRITNVATNGGTSVYPPDDALCADGTTCDPVASSEPEYTEDGGVVTYDGSGNPIYDTTDYTENHNLAAYMVYDMAICKVIDSANNCLFLDDDGFENADKKPDLNTGWSVIIPEENEVRVDNIGGIWIKLDGTLESGDKLIVVQSYHLMAWADASVDSITNWAQGDVMTFDIELEARQIDAPAPGSESGTASLILREKNPNTWVPVVNGAMGTMTYNTSGTELKYDLNASGLQNIDYSLIYYADDWPGNHPGALLGTFTASSNAIHVTDQIAAEVTFDLPDSADANYPVGAKIWLIPSNAYDTSSKSVTNWGSAVGNYLFEMNLIKFDKT